MAEGLFIIRLVLGLLLFAHGTQKLFGWFGGYGLDGTGGFFEGVGHRPGRLMAMVAGLSEGIGGLFLVLGLLTPWAAAMVMGTMYVAAVSVHAPHGLWATNGGYELPLTNGLIATGLAFTGAGGWSIDAAAGIPWTRGWGTGLAAIFLATVAGVVVLGRRRKVAEVEAETAYPDDAVAADPSVLPSDSTSG
jgi:putative oxidoreductase